MLHAKSLQSCPTLCDLMECSPAGSSVHGILQAGIPAWVAMPSSRQFSNPGIEPSSPVTPAMQEDSFSLSHLGSPLSQDNPPQYEFICSKLAMVLTFRASVPRQRKWILTIMCASTHVLVVTYSLPPTTTLTPLLFCRGRESL